MNVLRVVSKTVKILSRSDTSRKLVLIRYEICVWTCGCTIYESWSQCQFAVCCRADVGRRFLSLSDVRRKRSNAARPPRHFPGHGPAAQSLLHQLVSQHVPHRQTIRRKIVGRNIPTGAAGWLQVSRYFPSSVNGDIAIQWEWLNFDPSQNPNPLIDYDKTLHN